MSTQEFIPGELESWLLDMDKPGACSAPEGRIVRSPPVHRVGLHPPIQAAKTLYCWWLVKAQTDSSQKHPICGLKYTSLSCK